MIGFIIGMCVITTVLGYFDNKDQKAINAAWDKQNAP